MILAQLDYLVVLVGNGSRISSIGAENALRSDEHYVSSASSMRFLIILGAVIFLSHFLLNIRDFLLSFGTAEQYIHLEEGLPQCLLIVLLLIIVIGFKFFDEMPLDKGGHLCS